MRTGFLGRSGSHPPPPSPRDLVRYVAQGRPTKTACPRPPLRDHPFKTAMMHKTALQLRPRLRPRTRTLVPGTCRGDVVRVPCSLLASPRSNVPPQCVHTMQARSQRVCTRTPHLAGVCGSRPRPAPCRCSPPPTPGQPRLRRHGPHAMPMQPCLPAIKAGHVAAGCKSPGLAHARS